MKVIKCMIVRFKVVTKNNTPALVVYKSIIYLLK